MKNDVMFMANALVYNHHPYFERPIMSQKVHIQVKHCFFSNNSTTHLNKIFKAPVISLNFFHKHDIRIISDFFPTSNFFIQSLYLPARNKIRDAKLDSTFPGSKDVPNFMNPYYKASY